MGRGGGILVISLWGSVRGRAAGALLAGPALFAIVPAFGRGAPDLATEVAFLANRGCGRTGGA
jgi:hypothetical protein